MSLDAKIRVDSSQVQPALRNVERGTSRVFRQIGTAMQRGTASINGMVTSFRALSFSAGGIGVAVGLAFTGIVIAAKRVMTAINNIAARMKDIREGAARNNLGVKEYQQLSYVADRTGVSLNRLTSLYDKLNKAIENGKNGQKAYLDFFHSLRISILDLEDLNPTEMFDRITKSLRGNKIDVSELANVRQILGAAGIRDLNTIRGFDINGLATQAQAAGLVVDKGTMDAMIRFKQAMSDSGTAIMNNIIQLHQFQEALKSLTKTMQKGDKDLPKNFTTFNKEHEKFVKEAQDIWTNMDGEDPWEKAGLKNYKKLNSTYIDFLQAYEAAYGGKFESDLAKKFGNETYKSMKENPDLAFEIPTQQLPQEKRLDSLALGLIGRSTFNNGKFNSSDLMGNKTEASLEELRQRGNPQILKDVISKLNKVSRPEMKQSVDELKELAIQFSSANANGEDVSDLTERMRNLGKLMEHSAEYVIDDFDMTELMQDINKDLGDLNNMSTEKIAKRIDDIKAKVSEGIINSLFEETLDPKTLIDAIAAYNGQSSDDYINAEIQKLVGDDATDEAKQKALEQIFSFESINDKLFEFLDELKDNDQLDIGTWLKLSEKKLKDIDRAEEKYFKNIVGNLDKAAQSLQKETKAKVFKKDKKWNEFEQLNAKNTLSEAGLNDTEAERVMNLYNYLKAGKDIGESWYAKAAKKLFDKNQAEAESRKFDANQSVIGKFTSFQDEVKVLKGFGKQVARGKAVEDYAAARQMNVSDLSQGQVGALNASVDFGFDLEELKKRLSMTFSPQQLEQNELARKGGFTSYVRTKEDDRWKENIIEIKTLQDKINQHLDSIDKHTKALEGD